MNSRDASAKEILDAIGSVLLEDWDPIGVKREPMAQDEYDGCVGEVYRLIASGATADQLAEHLRRVEVERMGLGPGSAEALLPVAEKLLALDVTLKGGSVA
jgi:hypothetical protein